MKNNPDRNWSIELWGDGEDYRQINFRGTIDQVCAKADEEDSEVDWRVNRISIVALGIA